MERESQYELRLNAEWNALKLLGQKSSLFSLVAVTGRPASVHVRFSGKGIARINENNGEPTFSREHEVLIQIPGDFPQQSPDLKWLTPICHPNLSDSGYVELHDLGLEWTPDLTLEIICERLWDTIRLAYLDLSTANNQQIKNWFENDATLRLPVDARPLRDRDIRSQANIIQYSRREKLKISRPVAEREVLFIGEEIGATDSLDAKPAAHQNNQQSHSIAPPVSDDDEILFID